MDSSEKPRKSQKAIDNFLKQAEEVTEAVKKISGVKDPDALKKIMGIEISEAAKKLSGAEVSDAVKEITEGLLVNAEGFEKLRTRLVGRKGTITGVSRQIKDLDQIRKKIVGQKANQIRSQFEEPTKQIISDISSLKLEEKLKETAFDFTLPGKNPPVGNKHLVTQIIDEVAQIFVGLGYQVAEGPEVELDYYNFTALNTPADHPARSLQDTFYLEGVKDTENPEEAVLLRTHTSPVQIRVMEKRKPPLYIIAPGKAFRRDVADPSHTPMFHQIEGLAVDKDLSFGDLKGTLEVFVKQLFGEDRAVRFRPHFFPFTEPSAEVDVSCALCMGEGCRLCGSGWLEILGCGMVDPNVLEEVGVDSEEYGGFAFGMGVERIAVLKHGLDDIRRLYDNDVRFLEQF